MEGNAFRGDSYPANFLNGESTVHPHPALSESSLHWPVTRALEGKKQAFILDCS